MKIYRTPFLISTLLAISIVTSAQQSIKEDFLQRFYASNDTITSIQSDFVQIRTLSIMEEPLVSSGQFTYKKPELMKWDQQFPTPYYFILNGANVIRFDGEKRKKIAANSPQVSYFKDFILGTVSGSMFESEQFLSTFTKKGDKIKIVLVPQQKTMLKRIGKIELVFGYGKMVLLELTLVEAEGDKMAVHFSNQKFNTITSNAIFN